MTSPTRLYRVASTGHRLNGQVVTADDVCECDGCDGRGEIHVTVSEFVRHPAFPSETYSGETYSGPCVQCLGVGYVLGYPTAYEAIRLEVVDPGMEAGSPAGPSESVRKSDAA